MNKIYDKQFQDNHSIIISYPINYYSFPLAKNCKFIEIYLDANEYIFIPAYWMHWVFTEPYNLSMNYFIKITKDSDNFFFNNIKKKQPFKAKIDNNINFNFKDFFKKNLDNEFSICFNTKNHITPVIKPNFNCVTFMKIISFRESLSIKYKDYYKYIGQNINDNLFLNNLSNFIKDVNDNIIYKPSIWINFDKSINSGLHYDDKDNILINFIGKKKILLAHPDYRKYMYFQVLPKIDIYD
jgi:hypothetical protein